MVAVLDILRADYARFPDNQTYDIYDDQVYFKDPMTAFRGRDRYEKMVGFIQTWFKQPRMDVHELQQSGDVITTQWTLHWTTPLPWQPRISIPGRTEIKLNAAGKIISHIDTWDISQWAVIRQHFAASPL
jgi:hypothetical protein